ncbi:MAG: AAA family ATPase [Clostridiales bacterium]|nr:AAA family ATPase [Clostridiales bacterium]
MELGRRIAVIGSPGSGKSTLSVRLGSATGLPVRHLDACYWKSGWQPSGPEEWQAIHAQLIAEGRWIIDGSFTGSLKERLVRADCVVYLDIPRRVSLLRVLRRYLRYRGRSRPDMAAGCPETLDWEFICWIWHYRRTHHQSILNLLEQFPGQAFILHSRREAEAFLRTIETDKGTG